MIFCKYKQQGKVVVHGAPVGQQAGYMIWDVDSNKELQTFSNSATRVALHGVGNCSPDFY